MSIAVKCKKKQKKNTKSPNASREIINTDNKGYQRIPEHTHTHKMETRKQFEIYKDTMLCFLCCIRMIFIVYVLATAKKENRVRERVKKYKDQS